MNKHPASFRRPEKTSKVEQASVSWGGGCLFEKFRVIKPTFTLFYTVKWDNQKFDKKKPENEEFKQVKIKLERPEWILSR